MFETSLAIKNVAVARAAREEDRDGDKRRFGFEASQKSGRRKFTDVELHVFEAMMLSPGDRKS